MLVLGQLPGVRVWRQNAGKIVVGTAAGARVFRGMPTGAADIGGIGPGGVCLQIECKATGGTPTPWQREWGEMVETLGGIYLLARPGPGESCAAAVARVRDELAARLAARARP